MACLVGWPIYLLTCLPAEFDNGSLKNDPKQATKLIAGLMAGMVDPPEETSEYANDPLVRVHNGVWDRLAMASELCCPSFIRVSHQTTNAIR